MLSSQSAVLTYHTRPNNNLIVADKHPGAEVLGIDISPIQPSLVPPNWRFVVDDIFRVGESADWDHPKNHYDFVHCGKLCSAVKDLRALTGAAYRPLRPCGYFEVHEFIPFLFMDEAGPHVDSYQNDAELIPQASSKFNIDLWAPLRLADVFNEVGFRKFPREDRIRGC